MAVLTIGSLYIPNYNNTPWSQPGGVGTTVFPQEKLGVTWEEYPVPGQTWFEGGMLWSFGCGHWADFPVIFKDYDSNTSMSAAVICCPLCSYLNRLIEPYEEISNPLTNLIVIP